ncbi:MAG: hypothetical protein RIT28_4201 [Pseudomonadota bacterium]
MKVALDVLARHYDAIAPTYDAGGVEHNETMWRHTSTNVVCNDADIDHDDVVLDLGCGTGNVARTLAPHVRRVVGVDCSARMLDRARLNAPKNCEWVWGDLRQPPKVEGLTLITANYALHHLDREELRTIWRWAQRTLPPGGKLVIGDLFFSVPPDQVEGIDGWLDPALGEYHSAWELMKELEEHGFQAVLKVLHPVIGTLTAMRL